MTRTLSSRSTHDLPLPPPSPVPLGPLPALPAAAISTADRQSGTSPIPALPTVVLQRASLYAPSAASRTRNPVRAEAFPPSAATVSFSVNLERGDSFLSAPRSESAFSLASFAPGGHRKTPDLQLPPTAKRSRPKHKRSFSWASWRSRDASKETLQVVGKPRKVPYDYTSWRAPTRFDRFANRCRPGRRDGKSRSAGLEKSTSCFDLPATREGGLSKYRALGTRQVTAKFTTTPLTMSTVEVIPLPAHQDRSHHGPSPDEASGTGYLSWAAKGASYIPYASYLLGTGKTGPVSLKDNAKGPKRPTSPSPDDAAALLTQPLPLYFTNPWPSWQTFRLSDAYKAYQKGTVMKPKPSDEEEEDFDRHGRLVKVVKPQWRQSGRPSVCWLGHASTMVRIPWNADESGRGGKMDQTEMCGVLFDPIFSKRCSPSQWLGPARFLDPPCDVDELPPVHVVCISHDHYDHLDYDSIMALYKRNRHRIHFFVPLGVKIWFVSSNIPAEQVTELDWFQESIISISSSTVGRYTDSEDSSASMTAFSTEGGNTDRDSSDILTLKVVCTPAQHRSGRGIFDQMKTLWSSWVVGVVGRDDAAKEPGFRDDGAFRMFFGGDTGYRYAGAPEEHLSQAICPAFTEIAQKYGPVTLSLLPISTGSSLSFLRTTLGISLHHYSLTSPQHSNAWDALQIAKILGSKSTVAIHHSTFSPEDESRGCIHEFDAVRRDENISNIWGEEGCFVVADVGEVLEVEA